MADAKVIPFDDDRARERRGERRDGGEAEVRELPGAAREEAG
ncbi:glycerol acyltransferase, partial [Streptomyces sp. NEAU-H3]|nr:glycerol acyltransferase [Streptomyces sp. NEAU-H3]